MNMILILAIIFVLCVMFIGGDKTAKSLVTLCTNAIILFAVILVIYMGFNSLAVTAVGCVLVSLMTLFYQNEVNEKTKSALLATLITIAVLFGLICGAELFGHLQGFPVGQFEIRESNGYSGDIDFNMTLLEISVMLMAFMGAIIDVALSVTSSLYEVVQQNKGLRRSEIFRSGLSMGRSILSSSINTLYFIFIAEYFTLFIQFSQYYTFAEMFNSKEFAQQVVSIAVSGIGCVIIIPIVSAIAAFRFRSEISGKKESLLKAAAGRIKQ